MADLSAEDRPAVPPRPQSTASMNIAATEMVTREYFEESLEKVHGSLERKITEYHTTIERALRDNSSYIKVENFQVPSNSEALPVGEVERRMSALGEQVKTLTAENKKLEDEISSYKARLDTTRKEATEAIQRVSEQNSKYRGIILKGSSDNTDIPDDKILSQFVEIRDLIQRIVHRHYAVQGHKKLSIHNNPWFDSQKRFRDMLKGLALESLQRFCMRGKIFDMVNGGLISERSFGVRKFEHDLKDFEEALDCSKAVSHADLAEWRSRTIESGASLGEKSKWPGETCQDILDFMDPHISATTVGSDVRFDLLEKSMRELCDKAYSLSVLLRRSKKATFKISVMKDDTLVTAPVEAKVSCQAFDGPSKPGILGSRVAMTIFGGLLKIPVDSSDEQVDLEKSHVVCRTS